MDLHGTKHEDARRKVIRFVEHLWGRDEEAHIITGHSNLMKKIVTDILIEYKCPYEVGDEINKGYVRTTI